MTDGGAWASPTVAAGFRPTTAPSGDGDGWLLVANASPTQLSVKQFKITSGAGWVAGSTQILVAGSGTGYSYSFPHFTESRSDSPRACLTWSEAAPAPIGTNPEICFTPSHTRITGVLPWRYGGGFGVKVMRDTQAFASWWVCTSNSVYMCAADIASLSLGQRVTFISSQIVSFDLRQPGGNKASTGVLTVLNLSGYLSDAGVVGSAHQALRQWSQVVVSVGYRTSAGLDMVRMEPLWIEATVFHDDVKTGTPLVTIHMVNGWGILERLHFRQTVTYTTQTPEWLLDTILWHVCGTPAGTGNARLTAFTLSTFTFRAGESLALVARRLLNLVAVVLVFRPNQVQSNDGIGPEQVQCVGVSIAITGSVYAFGGGGNHPILQSLIAPRVAPSVTSVEVVGSTTTSLARNWAPAWLLWRDVEQVLVDKTLSVQATTDAVAANIATSYAPQVAGGAIEVMANCAEELQDQITVTIASAPVSAALYTVVGIRWLYARKDGRVLQVLTLEGTN